MTTYSGTYWPTTHSVPLPQIGLVGQGGNGFSFKPVSKPLLRFDGVPYPQFNPYTAVWWVGSSYLLYIPIKPLPQGAGGGGPVGTPIDSG